MKDTAALADATTMAEVLMWQAQHRPERRAFLFLERGERETESFTYAELDRRARVIALALLRNGLTGQRIILAYPTCIEFVAALFGCFYAGATAVPAPIDGHGRSATRLQAITIDADAAAVFSLRSWLDAATKAGNAMGAPTSKIPHMATDELPPAPANTALQPVDPGELALLQYTSGSTGNPRGVMLTHGNLIDNQRALSAVLASSAEDIVVNWLPLYHDMGLIGGVLHTIYFGGFSVLMAPMAFVQKPSRWLRAISHYRGSIGLAPGFAYGLVAQGAHRKLDIELDLSSWRVAICGGESIRPALLERFAAAFQPMGFDQRAFMPAYGLAEATLLAAAAPAGTGLTVQDTIAAATGAVEGRCEGWGRRLACCGPAARGQRIAIVDAASRTALPEGQAGEIWLRGPSVALGYWARPEDTREIFQAKLQGDTSPEFWLRTGDLGYMSQHGLVVTGRSKEIIVIRGANYDPLDIETVAADSDPAFEPAGGAAFSLEHEHSEVVVLVHEIKREALRSIDVHEMANKVVEAISRYFGLKIYDLVLLRPRTLPRTTSGKTQRHLCKQQYLAGELMMLQAIEHPALGRYRPEASALT